MLWCVEGLLTVAIGFAAMSVCVCLQVSKVRPEHKVNRNELVEPLSGAVAENLVDRHVCDSTTMSTMLAYR